MTVSREVAQAMMKHANRLHHLSMRYGAAFVELAKGEKVGLLPVKYPGLHEARDIVDLVLLCRAEINGLTALLIKKGVFTEDEFTRQVADEYEFLTNAKAQQLGVTVNDFGIVFSNSPDKN